MQRKDEQSNTRQNPLPGQEGFLPQREFDQKGKPAILTPEEVAQYLRKSCSWVYKHWQELGGVKLGGSLFFPSKEDLYERLFGQGKGVEVRLHPERKKVQRGRVQDEKGRPARGSQTKGGGGKGEGKVGDDRHGLLGPGQSQA